MGNKKPYEKTEKPDTLFLLARVNNCVKNRRSSLLQYKIKGQGSISRSVVKPRINQTANQIPGLLIQTLVVR